MALGEVIVCAWTTGETPNPEQNKPRKMNECSNFRIRMRAFVFTEVSREENEDAGPGCVNSGIDYYYKKIVFRMVLNSLQVWKVRQFLQF